MNPPEIQVGQRVSYSYEDLAFTGTVMRVGRFRVLIKSDYHGRGNTCNWTHRVWKRNLALLGSEGEG